MPMSGRAAARPYREGRRDAATERRGYNGKARRSDCSLLLAAARWGRTRGTVCGAITHCNNWVDSIYATV
jgi:hypothetical protein